MPEITRQQIVDAALSYAPKSGRPGVPYKAGGRDRDGLSCAGLLVAVGRETDYLTDEDIPGFSSFNEAEPMKKWFDLYLDPVGSWEEAQEGDIVATIGKGEDAQHCAVLVRKSERGLKYSYFVHALRNHGVVEGRLFGPYLAQVSGFYRLRGLAD